MRILITAALCLLSLCTSTTSSLAQQDKKPYVVVPREIGLTVIASQPDSPVQFEKAQAVLSVDKESGGFTFQLRNTGTKPIRSVTFAMSASNGGGWMNSRPGKITDALIMPGETIPLSENNCHDETVPLTEALRDKLELRGRMQAVLVLMVVQVRFADGSMWDDEKTYNALQEHFEKTAATIDVEPSPPKKQP